MTFRAVTIVDGVTMLVGDPNSESKVTDLVARLKNDLVAQLRKSVELTEHGQLSASTVVIWEGTATTWGTLSQGEKMCCERNADGVLEGGYPL